MASHFGIIGDIHGNFDALDAILGRHPDIPFWLCVGDVASQAGEYPSAGGAVLFHQGQQRVVRSDRGVSRRDGDASRICISFRTARS